jgi:hypothetical protein
MKAGEFSLSANVPRRGILNPSRPRNILRLLKLRCGLRFGRIRMGNLEQSRTPSALHDALMRKLLSGELRVPAAAQLVEATA